MHMYILYIMYTCVYRFELVYLFIFLFQEIQRWQRYTREAAVSMEVVELP